MKVIGIDIGGTSVKGIVVDESGNLLLTKKIDTEATRGKDHILEKVKKLIETLLSVHQDVAGIGIGTAGRVDINSGEVVYATDNLKGWKGVNLKEFINSTFHLPVTVDNDANAALVGEQWLGAGQGHETITMLTLGTGVGGANFIHGTIHHGATWSGGEWGHVILFPDGIPCNCGRKGCIEQYLSGTALVYFAKEATNERYSSGLDVMKDYQNGRKEIIPVVNNYVHHLVTTMVNIYHTINPEIIIIGGGVIESKAIWWNLFDKALAETGLRLNIVPACLGNTAGSVGAAKMVLNTLI